MRAVAISPKIIAIIMTARIVSCFPSIKIEARKEGSALYAALRLSMRMSPWRCRIAIFRLSVRRALTTSAEACVLFVSAQSAAVA